MINNHFLRWKTYGEKKLLREDIELLEEDVDLNYINLVQKLTMQLWSIIRD